LAEADELEPAIDEEFSAEEDDAVELDSDKLELLITTADADDEVDTDEEIAEDKDSELVEEIAVDELLIEEEIATEFDELTAEDKGLLLEPDLPPPPPPPPQATRLQPRIPIIIGFNKDVIIKLSRYCYSSLNHKRLLLVYQQHCKELNCAK
jgi:hypothetical protein